MRQIFERQSQDGWESSVVERLSKDLRREFPGIKGFSERNLWNMRSFFDGYRDRLILQQLVAEIPWGGKTQHLIRISNTPGIYISNLIC